MTDRDELRRLAEAATPGPWSAAQGIDWAGRVGDSEGVELADTREEQDAEFIAAANPEAVLELLDDLDAMRARAEKAEAIIERVKARHVRDENGDCWADGGPHPCPTMQALEEGDHE